MLNRAIVNRTGRVGLMVACAFFLCTSGATADDIFWHSTYESAMAEAKETGKPVFLEFRCVP
jgi:hypothetical protein